MDDHFEAYNSEKTNFQNIKKRIGDEKNSIEIVKERLKKLNEKKNQILDGQKKELNVQTEKVETIRKNLQERLSNYHLERTKKVKKYEIEKDENVK